MIVHIHVYKWWNNHGIEINVFLIYVLRKKNILNSSISLELELLWIDTLKFKGKPC